MTVSNLIQERHSKLNKQGARDGQSKKKKKKKKAQLVQQREVSSSKEPYVAAAKATSSDTKPPIVHYTKGYFDQLAVPSDIMPSSKASMAMDTLGMFYSSTSQDAMNEMCCLPFSTDSSNVLSTSSHRQKVDVSNNSGNQSYTTDYSMFVNACDNVDSLPREDVEQEQDKMMLRLRARSIQLQAAVRDNMVKMTTVSAPSSSDVSSLKDDTTPWPEDEIIPVIANINQRAMIAAEIMRANVNLFRRTAIAANMRANIMALTTCNEEKVSSPMKINSPPLSYTLPFCQPVSEEPSVGMILCRPTFDSSHQSPSIDDGVHQRSKRKASTYVIEELSVDDSEVFGMWSREHEIDKKNKEEI
jgi:hypothetical protein